MTPLTPATGEAEAKPLSQWFCLSNQTKGREKGVVQLLLCVASEGWNILELTSLGWCPKNVPSSEDVSSFFDPPGHP